MRNLTAHSITLWLLEYPITLALGVLLFISIAVLDSMFIWYLSFLALLKLATGLNNYEVLIKKGSRESLTKLVYVVCIKWI